MKKTFLSITGIACLAAIGACQSTHSKSASTSGVPLSPVGLPAPIDVKVAEVKGEAATQIWADFHVDEKKLNGSSSGKSATGDQTLFCSKTSNMPRAQGLPMPVPPRPVGLPAPTTRGRPVIEDNVQEGEPVVVQPVGMVQLDPACKDAATAGRCGPNEESTAEGCPGGMVKCTEKFEYSCVLRQNVDMPPGVMGLPGEPPLAIQGDSAKALYNAMEVEELMSDTNSTTKEVKGDLNFSCTMLNKDQSVTCIVKQKRSF